MCLILGDNIFYGKLDFFREALKQVGTEGGACIFGYQVRDPERYGVVEFGKDSVRAIAVTAGGLNSVPGSRHFNDQAERYATGNLRPVYFYRPDVERHQERVYKPGQ